MEISREWSVDGFSFEDRDLLKEAQKEAEGVRYVKSKVDLSQPLQVLQIYNRMLEQHMFQTEVGYAYLKELQEYLYTMPQVPGAQIKPIPVSHVIKVKDAAGTTEQLRNEGRKTGMALRWSVAVNVLLTCVIIVMFAIAASGDSTTILNYENQLIDRYSQWEEQLDEREADLLMREQAIQNLEEELEPNMEFTD